ncbi:MAG: type II toxin-antitoxin system HicA family toxin [Acidobacteriaceae bacterium]
MKHREIIKLLEADGWRRTRTSGSHAVYKHEQKPGIVMVPIHAKDLAKGTAAAILKQVGIK